MASRFSSRRILGITATLLGGMLLLASFGWTRTSDDVGRKEIATITAEELRNRLQSDSPPIIVDVREPDEYETGHIEGALLQPLGTVERLDFDHGTEIVLVCRSGKRSGSAYEKLSRLGFTQLWNLEGGMLAWERLDYPVTK